MRKPRKQFAHIVVGGTKYALYDVDYIKPTRQSRKNRVLDIWGQCSPGRGEILIKRGLGNSRTETILHEVAHAVSAEYGLNLHEDAVNTIGKEMCGIIRQLGLFREKL